MDSVLQFLSPDALSAALARLSDPSKRLSIWPILSAVLIAAFVFRRHTGRRAKLRRFMRFLFPASIWRHRSTGIDVQVALFNVLSGPIRRLVFGFSVAGGAALVAAGLTGWWGEPEVQMGGGAAAIALLAFILFLLTDFSTWLLHYLSHRWPFLWAFHRLHHSAEVLNPITVARAHPVYNLLARVLDLLILAPVQGLALYFWPKETGFATALAVSWGYGIFAMLGANLRHSHVWLSFGPLERFLVSPAQHQLHHSVAREHWNRNYGEVLAIWDWLFGTLVIAGRKRRKLTFGLAEGEAQPHNNLWQAMIEPFAFAGDVLRRRFRTLAARVGERTPAVLSAETPPPAAS